MALPKGYVSLTDPSNFIWADDQFVGYANESDYRKVMDNLAKSQGITPRFAPQGEETIGQETPEFQKFQRDLASRGLTLARKERDPNTADGRNIADFALVGSDGKEIPVTTIDRRDPNSHKGLRGFLGGLGDALKESAPGLLNFAGLISGGYGLASGLGGLLGAATGAGAAGLGAGIANITSDMVVNNAIKGAITSAITGGNPLEGAAKGAVLGTALNTVTAPIAASAASDFGGGALGQIMGGASSGAVSSGIGALISGQDPLKAAITSGGVGALTGGIGAMGSEYLSDLPKPLQSAATSAVASELLGGDAKTGAARALIGGLPGYARDLAGRPEAGEEGFFAPGGEGYDSWGKEEHVFDPTFGGTMPEPETIPYAVEPLPFDDTFIRETERPYQDFPEFETPFLPVETAPGADGVDINDPSNYPRSSDNPLGYDPNASWNQPLPVKPTAPVVAAPVAGAPAPAPATKSGSNTAALLAMLAQMGLQEKEPTASYQMAQIPVKSPFGLMYGMDQTGPYGMRG